MNKIFCIGDGYAYGHIWPEWPQILQALLPNYEVVLISGIGAGNEFLTSELLALGNAIQKHTVIFQWADPYRLDKLVQDYQWTGIGELDQVYHFNFYRREDRTWWLSSASKNSYIQEYHNFYIQDKQAELRLHNQKILIENYLQNNQCKYYFTSTHAQMNFSSEARFNLTRGNEIQPMPIVHYHFVMEILLPNIGIAYDKSRAEVLQQRISNQTWVAYNPDRAEIWQKLTEF